MNWIIVMTINVQSQVHGKWDCSHSLFMNRSIFDIIAYFRYNLRALDHKRLYAFRTTVKILFIVRRKTLIPLAYEMNWMNSVRVRKRKMREAGTISIRLRGGRNGFSSLYLRTILHRWSCLRGKARFQSHDLQTRTGAVMFCVCGIWWSYCGHRKACCVLYCYLNTLHSHV